MLFNSIRESFANFVYPEQRTERRRLNRLVDLDALTGLANRRAFDAALPAAELDPQTAIIAFDLNDFGKLNKKAGHRFGDVILKEAADTLIIVARGYGYAERVFRRGGDELAIFCPTAIAGRVRDEVESMFWIRAGVSISGTFAGTFDEADATLQARKISQKTNQKGK